MGLFQSRSRAGRSKVAARMAAGFLLGTIGLDLPDAGCDPLPLKEDRPALSLPAPAATDACDEVCVPDCFCCSSTVAAAQPMLIERPAAAPEKRGLLILPVAAGFSSVPDHVPIAGF